MVSRELAGSSTMVDEVAAVVVTPLEVEAVEAKYLKYIKYMMQDTMAITAIVMPAIAPPESFCALAFVFEDEASDADMQTSLA